MNIFRLLQIHLELGCVTFDHKGDLLHLPCPDSTPLPRVYLAHHPQGYITLFHHDVPPHLREAISAIAPEVAFENPAAVQQILAQEHPSQIISENAGFLFGTRIAPTAFPDVVRVEHAHSQLFANASRIAEQPVYAILADGDMLSACESARENKAAAEAWVRTDERFQRRGLGRQTASAWAFDLQQKNKIPFYTVKKDDYAAQLFASRLGLQYWLSDIQFS